MDRKRNLLPLAGLLVCLVGFFSYFFVVFRFPATRDVPWVSWLLFVVGLGLLVAGLRRPYRQPEAYRGRRLGPVLALVSLIVVGFFVFVTAVASRQLPASAGAPKMGAKAPDFVLSDPAGNPVRLYDLLGAKAGGAGEASWVVLIFYRGYW